MTFNRNVAPTGYLDLRLAIGAIRLRMYGNELRPEVIKATSANVEQATYNPNYAGVLLKPVTPTYDPGPTEYISGAINSGHLTLFICTETRRIISAPTIRAQEILTRAGLLGDPRAQVVFRFRDFHPRQIFDDLDLPGFRTAGFHKLALCLRESQFDAWLGRTSQQQHWPLGERTTRELGRPKLIPVLKPIVKGVIDSNRWQPGMPLKSLVVSVRAQFGNETLDRETVKKALSELYRETRQLEYKYVPRKRAGKSRAK